MNSNICGVPQDIKKWNDTGQPQTQDEFKDFNLDDKMMQDLIAQSQKCSNQATQPEIQKSPASKTCCRIESHVQETEFKKKIKPVEKSCGSIRNSPYVSMVYYVLSIWNTFIFLVVVLGQIFIMTAHQDQELLRELDQEHNYQELLFRVRQSSLIIFFGVTCFLIKYCSSKSSNGQKLESIIYQHIISRELVWALRGFFHVAVAANHIWNFYKIQKVALKIQFMSGEHQIFEMSTIQSKINYILQFAAIAILAFSIKAIVLLTKNYKDFQNLILQFSNMVKNTVISIFQLIAQVVFSKVAEQLIECIFDDIYNTRLILQSRTSQYSDLHQNEKKKTQQIKNFFKNIPIRNENTKYSFKQECNICFQGLAARNLQPCDTEVTRQFAQVVKDEYVMLDCSLKSHQRWYHKECLLQCFESKIECPFCRCKDLDQMLQEHNAYKIQV